MRIGKTVKVVTSPKRQVRKFNHKKQEQPIPVKMPEKVESFKYIGHMWGLDVGYGKDRTSIYLSCVTS